MKAIFIAYNQALTERITFILDKCMIRGYTKWDTVHGRGSVDGTPHFGSHAWPELNSAMLAVVEDERVELILKSLKKLDEKTSEQGIRAFVWNVEDGI
ncbi:MAG: hypothetical protein LBG19_09325 [Prevotellaceae bacterium]|jgi:nitrogen regulatory protein PII|nr:hypothetical protein [Prevotellaceae bacterium]